MLNFLIILKRLFLLALSSVSSQLTLLRKYRFRIVDGGDFLDTVLSVNLLDTGEAFSCNWFDLRSRRLGFSLSRTDILLELEFFVLVKTQTMTLLWSLS